VLVEGFEYSWHVYYAHAINKAFPPPMCSVPEY
jgi:hypothetical protein